MARCIISDVDYEIRNTESLVNERERLLGRNANMETRRISDTEMEMSQPSTDHMLPLERDLDDTDNQRCPASGMLLHSEPSVRNHCHIPATSEDPVARNQLIAISVLCFVFMVAEVVGEFHVKKWGHSFRVSTLTLNAWDRRETEKRETEKREKEEKETERRETEKWETEMQ